MTAKFLPRLDEDDRLIPILSHLSQGFLAGVPSEWSAPSSGSDTEIKAEMVDQLARKHFPMCMRNLNERLRKDHHLKHFGRLQYGLFLKASRIPSPDTFLILRARRCWDCPSRKQSRSGGSPSATSRMINSTRNTNTTSDIHLAWKASEPTIQQRGDTHYSWLDSNPCSLDIVVSRFWLGINLALQTLMDAHSDTFLLITCKLRCSRTLVSKQQTCPRS